MQTSSKPFRQTYARTPVMGAAFGFLIVFCSIALSAHSFLAFFSLGGLIIVVGGVIAVAFMSFPTADVHKALNAIKTMLNEPNMKHENLRHDMKDIISWAHLIKEKGMLGLEGSITKNSFNDSFIKYGLNMVVSEYTPKDIRAMMKTAADANYERDCIPVDVLHAMTSHAPAFGMVGTLVGMVAMLCNLSDNVSSVGSTLAVAFLSTLYGVISARMVYMPAASRLQQEVDSRFYRNNLITEGMIMLASKKTPMYIQDRLNGFLRPEIHDYFDPSAKPIEPMPRPHEIASKHSDLKVRQITIPRLKAVGI